MHSIGAAGALACLVTTTAGRLKSPSMQPWTGHATFEHGTNYQRIALREHAICNMRQKAQTRISMLTVQSRLHMSIRPAQTSRDNAECPTLLSAHIPGRGSGGRPGCAPALLLPSRRGGWTSDIGARSEGALVIGACPVPERGRQGRGASAPERLHACSCLTAVDACVQWPSCWPRLPPISRLGLHAHASHAAAGA